VDGGDSHPSWLWFRSDPNRSRSSDQRKRIIANDLTGAFQLELDRVVGKGPDRSEFVGNVQNQTSSVRTVGNELGVVRNKQKLRIDIVSGEIFCNHLFSLDVSLYRGERSVNSNATRATIARAKPTKAGRSAGGANEAARSFGER
jgi:hypothetical protein